MILQKPHVWGKMTAGLFEHQYLSISGNNQRYRRFFCIEIIIKEK